MNDSVEKLAKELYYMNPNMIEFLIVENLALKSLLYEKGLIDPDEYKKHQEQANLIVEARVSEQIDHWKNSNSKIYDTIKALQTKANQSGLRSKDDAVVS